MTHVNISTFPINHQATGFDIEVHIPKGTFDMKEFNKRLPKTLKNIAKEGKSFWESEAGRKLKTARVKYRDGIKINVIDNRTIVLEMDDFGATLEKGREFDMKPGFMASGKVRGRLKLPKHVAQFLPKVKNASPQRFLIVPMRWPRKNDFGQVTRFRTVTDKSLATMWIWKRKEDGRDLELSRVVVKELEDVIIPKHLTELIESCWSGR